VKVEAIRFSPYDAAAVNKVIKAYLLIMLLLRVVFIPSALFIFSTNLSGGE